MKTFKHLKSGITVEEQPNGYFGNQTLFPKEIVEDSNDWLEISTYQITKGENIGNIFNILAVKRLSDNTIFEIGQAFVYTDGKEYEIVQFVEFKQNINVFYIYNDTCIRISLYDIVNISNYYVDSNTLEITQRFGMIHAISSNYLKFKNKTEAIVYISKHVAKKYHVHKETFELIENPHHILSQYVTFNTKEEALTYIDDNKKCYTFNDIIKALEFMDIEIHKFKLDHLKIHLSK